MKMPQEEINLGEYASYRPPFSMHAIAIAVFAVIGGFCVVQADKHYDKPGLIASLILYCCIGFGATLLAVVSNYKAWMRSAIAGIHDSYDPVREEVSHGKKLDSAVLSIADQLGPLLTISKGLNGLRVDQSLAGNEFIKVCLRNYRHELDTQILMIVRQLCYSWGFGPHYLDKELRAHSTPEGLSDSLRNYKNAAVTLRDLPGPYRHVINEYALRMDRPAEPAEAATR